MKPYCIYVFTASILLLFVLNVSSNQKDDIVLVEKLIELYPDVDLSKEAILQTEIIAKKYSKDQAAILSGKIRYKINQKSLARKSFTQVLKNSKYFKESILTYYLVAVSDEIKDGTGVKESTEIFIDNKLWTDIEDRSGEEWDLVKAIFKSYSDLNRNDRSKMAHLKKILSELDIVLDLDGEVEILISESEKIFINDWKTEPGKVEDKKKLESLLELLRDLEFGEQNYEFFTAFPNRARILCLLGETDKALKLLEKSKSKVVEYDAYLKKHLNDQRDLTKEERAQALAQMSVLAQWYYAKALCLFQSFRSEYKNSKEKSGELLFGKYGSVVNFFLCVKKFPENKYSYKSILAFQKLRELVSKEYSKNIKELIVPDLVQGKAFYIAEDYEKALSYLAKAVLEKDDKTAYSAYNLAVGAAIKLEKFNEADAYFKDMSARLFKLNKAPNDYITKLTNFCVVTYLKKASEEKELSDKDTYFKRALRVYENAQACGKQKSNISVKYLFASRVLNDLLKQKKEKINKGLAEFSPVINSLLDDHRLSKESAKISKTLGIVYQKTGQIQKSIKQIELYLERIKTFSTKQDEDQIKMKMFLLEMLVAEGELEKAEKGLSELSGLPSKFGEGIVGIKLKLLHSSLLKSEDNSLREEYIKQAEKYIAQYKDSKSRPYVIAQLAVIYQNGNNSEKANQLYGILQKEYPEHGVNQGTGFNQVLALLKSGKGVEALKVLSSYDGLAKMKPQNLYAIAIKIDESLLGVELSEDSANQFNTVLSYLDESDEKPHVIQKIAIMKSKINIQLGQYKKAEKVLLKAVEAFPRGSYIIETKLLLAKSYSKQGKFTEVSKVYASLQSMVSRLDGGQGNSSLSIRVAAECCDLFSDAKEEKYYKKGKYISYLAAQYNVSKLVDADLPNLEKVEYWNAWYSHKLGNNDFLELKKSFLRRYPASKYAPELRKL